MVHLRAATQQPDTNLLASSGPSQLVQGAANPGQQNQQQKENKPKPKTKKEPNYATKASAKIKSGRSTVTDGNYWKRVILEDGQTQKPKANLALCIALLLILLTSYVYLA